MRTGLLLGVAIGCEALVAFLLPILTPGHSLGDDYISTAAVPGSLFAVSMAVLGMLGAALHVWAFTRLWPATGGWHRVSLGMTMAFLTLLGSAFLVPCDPGCALETPTAQAHHVLGTVGFTLLGLAALVHVATTWPWRAIAGTGIALGLADLALLSSDLTGELHGLTERLTIASMWAWSVAWWRELAPGLQRKALAPRSPS